MVAIEWVSNIQFYPGVRFGTFAGDTIDIFDPITGEAHAIKLFVGDGAWNYTYAEARSSETLPTHEPWRPVDRAGRR